MNRRITIIDEDGWLRELVIDDIVQLEDDENGSAVYEMKCRQIGAVKKRE